MDGEGTLIEAEAYDVGFRQVSVRDGLLQLNGKPLLIRGVNRHEHRPANGQTMDEQTMVQDILLMKQNNFNAVRCSHYPNTPLWYRLCDRYGLYVVDEANIETHGMEPMSRLADDPVWFAAFSERVTRMVQCNRHHASIIIWSLGNEAGHGATHDALYRWVKTQDPSRPVQYEGAAADTAATDILCPMYAQVEEDLPIPAVPKWAIKKWIGLPASSVRLSCANTPTPWVTASAALPIIGGRSANIPACRVDSFGIGPTRRWSRALSIGPTAVTSATPPTIGNFASTGWYSPIAPSIPAC